jgi:hypothetical protein
VRVSKGIFYNAAELGIAGIFATMLTPFTLLTPLTTLTLFTPLTPFTTLTPRTPFTRRSHHPHDRVALPAFAQEHVFAE